MVKEIRKIFFSFDEVTDALSNYGNLASTNIPAGKVIKLNSAAPKDVCEIKDNIENGKSYNIDTIKQSMVLTYFDGENLNHNYITLPADFISIALVEYCLSKNIILPKTSSKKFEITELSVTLVVSSVEDDFLHDQTSDLRLED